MFLKKSKLFPSVLMQPIMILEKKKQLWHH